MEIDESQVNILEGNIVFLQKYIQKQEKMFLEQFRKSIENEIKTESISVSFAEMSNKYEESQKQVDIQNNMMQQAANGLEIVTVERDNLKQEIEKLNSNLEDFYKQNKKLKDEIDELKIIRKELEDLKKEYHTQTEELNIIYKQNCELNEKPSKIKKNI